MLRILLAGLLVTALQACTATQTQSSVDGSWNFSMSSPFGAVTAEVTLITSSASLTGSFDLGNGRTWPIENGVVNGNEISFSIDRDGSPMVYEMSATIIGDTAMGTAQAMGTEVPWSMTRNN